MEDMLIQTNLRCPGAPLTYFNDGGEDPSDFLGSEILAQTNFFGSMKDAGIFLGRKKNQKDFLGLRKKGLRDFLGYAKKSSDFFG